MANNRQAIRAAMKALLLNNTDAGANVYSNRKSPAWQSELPAIFIHNHEEPLQSESINVQRYVRNFQVLIDVMAEATASVDDTLDQIAAEVETIIGANPSISGTCISTIQKTTEFKFDSDGETPVGVATITFECQYIS